MGRTSIKNKLILSFLALLFIVIAAVAVVNHFATDFFMAQAISASLAMAAGVIFGGIFSKSLVKRLNFLGNFAAEVRRGDLSKDLYITSQDEVRDLEEGFSRMVNDLRDMITRTKKVSEQISQTNEELSSFAGKVLTKSKEIDSSAKTIASGSQDQAAIVEKTAIKLEEGLNTMQEMVSRSASAVSKVNEAYKKTESGEANARQTINHLEMVLKQMMEDTEPMYRLMDNVEKIKVIMNVMNEIAQKTDILSLNASIEATRAGEAGKGFALVAEEIRNMAENSRRSSTEIGEMVEAILEDNKTVTNSLDQSRTRINEGRQILNGIAGTFGEMLSGAKDIAAIIQEVQNVTDRQVKELRSLLNHFSELSRLAKDNLDSTQKTTVATKEQKKDMVKMVRAMQALDAQSKEMMEAQRHFKV